MDTEEEDNIPLDLALKQKLTLIRRLLKAQHHGELLKKCLEVGRMPTGLKIQSQEIFLMNSPFEAQTRTNLLEIFNQAEKSIVEALIEHQTKLVQQTEVQLERIERTIACHMNRKDSNPTQYRMFLSKLEKSQDHIKNSL